MRELLPAKAETDIDLLRAPQTHCPARLLRRGKQGAAFHVSLCLAFHSSEQSAKADTHQELIRTLKELKVHLPADKKAKGRASTLATLKYALRSVKQVKGAVPAQLCRPPQHTLPRAPKLQLTHSSVSRRRCHSLTRPRGLKVSQGRQRGAQGVYSTDLP